MKTVKHERNEIEKDGWMCRVLDLLITFVTRQYKQVTTFLSSAERPDSYTVRLAFFKKE